MRMSGCGAAAKLLLAVHVSLTTLAGGLLDFTLAAEPQPSKPGFRAGELDAASMYWSQVQATGCQHQCQARYSRRGVLQTWTKELPVVCPDTSSSLLKLMPQASGGVVATGDTRQPSLNHMLLVGHFRVTTAFSVPPVGELHALAAPLAAQWCMLQVRLSQPALRKFSPKRMERISAPGQLVTY
jgi:hypothetical protein